MNKMAEIIGSNSQAQHKNSSERINLQKTTTDNSYQTQRNSNQKTTRINYSAKMREITNKQYKCLYYINTKDDMTRVEMADIWNQTFPTTTNDILKTQKGFLIKSDTDKYKLLTILAKLMATKKINS